MDTVNTLKIAILCPWCYWCCRTPSCGSTVAPAYRAIFGISVYFGPYHPDFNKCWKAETWTEDASTITRYVNEAAFITLHMNIVFNANVQN